MRKHLRPIVRGFFRDMLFRLGVYDPPIVSPHAPTIFAAPAITGTPQVGQTLVLAGGTSTGYPDPDDTYALVHSVNGTVQTSLADYLIPPGDMGGTYTLQQISSNGVNPDATASSAATAVVVETSVTPPSDVPEVVLYWTTGDSNIRGAATDGSTLTGSDAVSDLWVVNPAGGSIALFDPAVGSPTPGGGFFPQVPVGLTFARSDLAARPSGTIGVIVQLAVGGSGIQAGAVGENGRWSPDGAGPAWKFGDSAADTNNPSSLFLGVTTGAQAGEYYIPDAVRASVEAEFGTGRQIKHIIIGSICSPVNDINATMSSLYDKTPRAMTAIRNAIEAAIPPMAGEATPWILNTPPPEWSFNGASGREKGAFVARVCSQILPNVAFVEGPNGFQDTGADAHFSNDGYRVYGSKLHSYLALAEARASAPRTLFDVLDGATGLHCARSMIRLRSDAGRPMRVSNGITAIDVALDGNGLPDFAAIEALGVSDQDVFILEYDDQDPNNLDVMVPDPLDTNTAKIYAGGEFCMQGNMLAHGNDEGDTQLFIAGQAGMPGGALLAVGRTSDGGNAPYASWDNDVFAVYGRSNSGTRLTQLRIDGVNYWAGETVNGTFVPDTEAHEPSWAFSGAGMYANLVMPGVFYRNGVSVPFEAGFGTSVGTNETLGWGGRRGQTNRYSNGSHVALIVYDVAPTGAALDALLEWCALIGARDDTPAQAALEAEEPEPGA